MEGGPAAPLKPSAICTDVALRASGGSAQLASPHIQISQKKTLSCSYNFKAVSCIQSSLVVSALKQQTPERILNLIEDGSNCRVFWFSATSSSTNYVFLLCVCGQKLLRNPPVSWWSWV